MEITKDGNKIKYKSTDLYKDGPKLDIGDYGSGICKSSCVYSKILYCVSVCTSECSACTGAKVSECSSCNEGYFLETSTCTGNKNIDTF